MVNNFVIVGTQRTGSTALVNLLNLHPDVACGAEWARRVPWHRKLRVIENGLAGVFSGLESRHRATITQIYREHKRWLGCKILFRSSDKWVSHPRLSPALWLDRLEEYLRWIAQRPDIHIIHLTRSHAIEWLKSKYMAEVTGSYMGKQYPDDMKVTIPVSKAVKRVYAKNWLDARLEVLAHSNPYQHIFYEDLLNSNYDVTVCVLQFLGCDTTKLPENVQNKQSVKRQSRGDATNYISNYDQLIKELEKRSLFFSNQG
jgi:hypothetical protein